MKSVNIFFALIVYLRLLFNIFMKENALSVIFIFFSCFLFRMIQADLNIVQHIGVSLIQCVQLWLSALLLHCL